MRLLTAIIFLGIPTLSSAQNLVQSNYVTRSEAAKFVLSKVHPPIEMQLNEGALPDVMDGDPYSPYVIAAVQRDFWDMELGNQRAYPHKIITRGEYLRMLVEGFDLPKYEPFVYLDVDPEDPVGRYAGAADMYKLFIDPSDPARLRADIPITHREAAQALYIVLKKRPDLQAPYRFRETIFQASNGTVVSFKRLLSRHSLLNSLKKQHREKTSVSVEVQADVIAEVNKYRDQNDLPPLLPNLQLQQAAQNHAKDMVERDYFSHFTPEGGSYIDRIKASGYTDVDPIQCGCQDVFTIVDAQEQATTSGENFVVFSAEACQCQPRYALGENLGKGQYTAQEVVADWMNSPGHRRNILESAFSEIGIGLFRDVWVQNFGTFEVGNQ